MKKKIIVMAILSCTLLALAGLAIKQGFFPSVTTGSYNGSVEISGNNGTQQGGITQGGESEQSGTTQDGQNTQDTQGGEVSQGSTENQGGQNTQQTTSEQLDGATQGENNGGTQGGESEQGGTQQGGGTEGDEALRVVCEKCGSTLTGGGGHLKECELYCELPQGSIVSEIASFGGVAEDFVNTINTESTVIMSVKLNYLDKSACKSIADYLVLAGGTMADCNAEQVPQSVGLHQSAPQYTLDVEVAFAYGDGCYTAQVSVRQLPTVG